MTLPPLSDFFVPITHLLGLVERPCMVYLLHPIKEEMF